MPGEDERLPIKTLIILQLLLTAVGYLLVRFFYAPAPAHLWWRPGEILQNVRWGFLGALILFFPAGLYARYRPQELFKAVKPLLSVCRHSISVLLLISFLAGLGEELLFRAFLQRLLGLAPAAVLFMLAHAGFWAVPPRSQARILFAPFTLAAGLILGLLAREIGLISAIIAHFLYDLGAFYLLKAKFVESSPKY